MHTISVSGCLEAGTGTSRGGIGPAKTAPRIGVGLRFEIASYLVKPVLSTGGRKHERGEFLQGTARGQVGQERPGMVSPLDPSLCLQCQVVGGRLPVSQEEVIQFLRSLLQSRTPAWQRLQAVRAIEAYRDLVLQARVPPLDEIRQTLSRLADQERAVGPGSSRPGVADERHLIGQIDPNEPGVVQKMRGELRVRHKSLETERAYVGWVQRFIQHCGSSDLASFGEQEIKAFLTHLAVERDVTAGTQKQAKCALLFLYQMVLGRELGFLDVGRPDKPSRLPVVLSRPEISVLLPEFRGLRLLMFLVMYGAGLRHRECRRLRVKDVCFDEGHIVVRSGKGDQDRITVLPQRCRDALREQIEAVRRLHQRDLNDGFGAVYLPHALERKYPNENREFGWQWVFPARQLAKDPRSGKFRRHHVSESFFAEFFKQAADRQGLSKTPCRIRCGTVSRRICSRMATISARCRSCSDTRTCGRR